MSDVQQVYATLCTLLENGLTPDNNSGALA